MVSRQSSSYEFEIANSLGSVLWISFLLRMNQLAYMYNKIMAIAQIQIKSLEHLLARRQDVTASTTLPVGLPDSAAYYYLKEASFLSKKEERWSFYFFQGLNTNPQNMSIYLRDQAARENKNTKQKLAKGVFVIFDLFSKTDVVIEINIPGNLRIYKLVSNKKELVSNEEMDLMYLSSVLRSMYQHHLTWGRSYLLFHDSKNYIAELKGFFHIAFRSLLKRDVNLGSEFESIAKVKGSHACSLIFSYLKERRLVRQAIQLIEDVFKENKQYKNTPKYGILLAQFYMQFGKTSKSLELIFYYLNLFPKEPFLMYYQSKYLLESGLYEQALLVANSIVQYNQFQIWILLAQIHLELKNFAELLACLNHAAKQSKIKSQKHSDWSKSFEQLGKIKHNSSVDGIEYNPRLLLYTDNPLNIMIKQVQQKNKCLIERGYWKLNQNEKIIYCMMQDIRYRLDIKKFQQLLMNTFQDNIMKYEHVSIKKGMTEPIPQNGTVKLVHENTAFNKDEDAEDLPDFLKNSIDKVEESVSMKPSRNLSIIPEIESVIENSNYEQRQKDKAKKHVRLKRQVNESLFRIIQLILAEGQFQKAEYENNVGKILQTYNKMRTSSKFNNYYADLMFKIFMQTANYKSIIVLIAETLDFLEQRGVRKMDKLPYWMHKYLFFIIEEKGLKFLNDMLQKLNFYDEAIIDTIQIAKNWRMKGVTY